MLDEPTTILDLRPAPVPFNVGELFVDERLDIRGIFVGVSFDRSEAFNEAVDGGSLCPWWPSVPTLGDPAMVGKPFRELRRDTSETFCIELIV